MCSSDLTEEAQAEEALQGQRGKLEETIRQKEKMLQYFKNSGQEYLDPDATEFMNLEEKKNRNSGPNSKACGLQKRSCRAHSQRSRR